MVFLLFRWFIFEVVINVEGFFFCVEDDREYFTFYFAQMFLKEITSRLVPVFEYGVIFVVVTCSSNVLDGGAWVENNFGPTFFQI